MSDIKRIKPGPRMSQGVIHGKTLYCAGQVGEAGASVTRQTETALAALDAVLAEAGTDKTRLLQVTIWLADMADFAEMNAVDMKKRYTALSKQRLIGKQNLKATKLAKPPKVTKKPASAA